MTLHDWSRVPAKVFHDFHVSWVARLKETLNGGLLPDGFHARAEQSFEAFGRRYSDVLTLREGDHSGNGSLSGATAVAVAPPKARVHESLPAMAPRLRRVAVRTDDSDELVAVIEIVSTGNKDRKDSAAAFVAKAAAALERGIHVVVLDLLPPTKWTPGGFHAMVLKACRRSAADVAAAKQPGPTAFVGYEVSADGLDVYADYPAVGDPLPETPLFLAPGWYVPLPLPATYAATVRGLAKMDRQLLTAEA